MSLKGLEYLGFSDHNYRKILEMIAKTKWYHSCNWENGSGKSTTVYLFYKIKQTTNVITVEDPAEMDIEEPMQASK